MFRVWHSNRLDLLKDLVTSIMENDPLPDPLAQEVVLVQSPGMAQWLQMALAQGFQSRIAANILFPLPATFIWQMFVAVLPGIPAESAFTKSAMSWKLMHLLPLLRDNPEFEVLSDYLSQDSDQRKLYQLSAQVADLFDHYLVYRPEWLALWQRGELIPELGSAQIWQAPLWQALVRYTAEIGQPEWHRANLYQRFIQRLADEDLQATLPRRVFICGISSLPPIYLQALEALGRHIDIHLLFTNPCQEYWGDIQDRAFLARLLTRRRKVYALNQRRWQETGEQRGLFKTPDLVETLFSAEGEQALPNPLLASWGRQGRDNLYLLAQMESVNDEVHAFVESEPTNLLSQLQHDILTLEDYSVVGLNTQQFATSHTKRQLAVDDHSITINSCHNAQREVEVLRDYLLTLLDNDPDLSPRDIIVMVADIDIYAPYIQAVFSRVSNHDSLPFSISDRSASHAHPVIHAFIQLLLLPDSRFTSEQVLALLEVPALAERFAISETQLQRLRLWVEESGIRWGLDDESAATLALPVTGQHTWQFGIQRMLLGYAMDSTAGDWQGILPYDESAGLMGELAGQLAEFLSALTEWRERLTQSYTLEEWLPYCRQLTERFFIGDAESQAALEVIHEQWRKMIQEGIDSRYTQAIPMTLLRDELRGRLEQQRISQRFLAGQVNFCTLMPMRSIPFKVVCLLGMNDGVYPRTLQPSGFDLMPKQPRKGDRNRRDDDRYLFLEALVSAQHYFYISYVGCSIQDNQPRLASVLVTELLEYIGQSFCLPGDEACNVDESAQHVQQHLVRQQPRTPFAVENFTDDNPWHSFSQQWVAAANRAGTPPLDFAQTLSAYTPDEVSINTLASFWRHPIRAWFTRRLGIYFQREAVGLPESEPFVQDNLTRYQLNQRLLNCLIEQQSPEQLYRHFRLAGQLPYGAYGRLIWQRQCTEMESVAQSVVAQRQTTQSMEIDLQLVHTRVVGWLPQVQPDGLLRWRPGKLNLTDGLLLWIEHLLYCAMGGKGISRMYGRDETCWRFLPVPIDDAITQLERMIQGYYQGMMAPLWLLKESGGSWLQASMMKNSHPPMIDWQETTQNMAQQRLHNAWHEGYLMAGEGRDPYLQRLAPQLTPELISEICQQAENWYLPVLQAHTPETVESES
ncbi:exodeoxyribonuclease V subunit gamma [Rosenbergiella australiborealis]|uniref:RecBCD enzyme subunit RecC n=1 Tax=Rosenbergiella australiborealis TaxID=1544696 RepID=A0ABS5T7K5_9GAMM|nr:exodeoxyribonuclease V subunit gamma [Rosenbergiella australiborealis]MBT0728354.1 exodeoxyribonuclease V subunit gamma [Rosenbergiella australiborealis]